MINLKGSINMSIQFSEKPQKNYFLSQPHQPFFVLGFVNAIVTMLIFMLSYKGVSTLTWGAPYFHAYSLIFMLFTPVFLAFIFTTFPRFAGTPAIKQSIYIEIFSLFVIGSILFIIGALFNAFMYKTGMFLLLSAHAWGIKILLDIFKSTKIEDKYDLFWILTTMIFGVVSHALFILGVFFSFSLQGFATQIAIYLYVFLVTFSVAQRMVPFFSHCTVEKNKALLKIVTLLLITRIFLELIYPHLVFLADITLAFVIGKELYRWELPFPNANPLLWILHISLFWIPVAFFFSAIANLLSLLKGTSFLLLDMHTLMLVFVFTILIGFGTRVTLGHSGNMMQADKWVTGLFYLTQVVVLMRILVSLVAALGWNFMILFDISVTVWLLLFILWAVRFFAVLIKGKKLS
jgi:uncharacterized protein involved in response to NO